MFRSICGMLAAILLLAACSPVERPRLGPPAMRLRDIRTLGEAPVKGEAVRFAFAEITGTPGAMRYAMEDYLKQYAASRNLVIVAEDDPTAVYRVKGYLQAVGDTTGGLLIYTWDVSDAAGRKLHRFSGQLVTARTEADPWAAVTVTQIGDAARETIDGLADWLRG